MTPDHEPPDTKYPLIKGGVVQDKMATVHGSRLCIKFIRSYSNLAILIQWMMYQQCHHSGDRFNYENKK